MESAMINMWAYFPLLSAMIILCWGTGIVLCWRKQRGWSWIGVGTGLLASFIVALWVFLERPPLQTYGETRVWYAVLLSSSGAWVAWRWRLWWLVVYSIGCSALFLLITVLNPESHDKALIPALQSPWFIPHVVVYLLAYALLTAASLTALRGLWRMAHGTLTANDSLLADALTTLGLAFLTMGLFLGAIWAKDAWGHYWTWDPKETWAFLTWSIYLGYVHLRACRREWIGPSFLLLGLAWEILLFCWFGVNYLPSAGSSLHTYLK
jgi:ABC-type transport system involved in cytochrome c biogenesis permease subunit